MRDRGGRGGKREEEGGGRRRWCDLPKSCVYPCLYHPLLYTLSPILLSSSPCPSFYTAPPPLFPHTFSSLSLKEQLVNFLPELYYNLIFSFLPSLLFPPLNSILLIQSSNSSFQFPPFTLHSIQLDCMSFCTCSCLNLPAM